MFFVVWFHAFGVCGGELGEGLFPVGGDPALDEPALAFVAPALVRLLPLPCAFVLDVADREPQELDGCLVVGELAAVAADLPELVVQRFDAVGRVDHAPQHGREPQERREPVPRPLPRGRHRWVPAAKPALPELVERLARLLLVDSAVHLLELPAHGLAVVVVDEPVGGADRMHHAGLRHRLRPCGLDGLGQALQPVAAHDRHVRNAPVGHLRAHVRPERGSLRIPDPDARHVPEPLHVDADRAVHGLHTTLPPSPTFTRIASRHMTG